MQVFASSVNCSNLPFREQVLYEKVNTPLQALSAEKCSCLFIMQFFECSTKEITQAKTVFWLPCTLSGWLLIHLGTQISSRIRPARRFRHLRMSLFQQKPSAVQSRPPWALVFWVFQFPSTKHSRLKSGTSRPQETERKGGRSGFPVMADKSEPPGGVFGRVAFFLFFSSSSGANEFRGMEGFGEEFDLKCEEI